MALSTVNLTFEDELIKQIDYFADSQSLTRADFIYNSVKMSVNRKQRLLDLYAYGERVAAETGFTEEDILDETKKHRTGQ